MLHQILQFVIRHWALVGGFIIVSILLFLDEARSQSASGGKITSARATFLINREDALIVDLRDVNAYRDGHIIGAKNYPVADFDRYQEKLALQPDRAIILVDAMGIKTAPIATRLKKAGFHNVASLKGGMDAWKADNMPIVKGK